MCTYSNQGAPKLQKNGIFIRFVEDSGREGLGMWLEIWSVIRNYVSDNKSSFSLDGRSNRGNLNAAAPALRNSGVQVYAVGIGNIDVNELRLISSDPDDDHVFILSSFLDAAGFVDFLSVTTCDSKSFSSVLSRV